LHQVGTSSLLIYMMHGHTYINFIFSSFQPLKFYVTFPKCLNTNEAISCFHLAFSSQSPLFFD